MIDEKKYVKIVSNPAETPRQQVVETTQINNQNITITENGVYEADEGYTGIGVATVLVPNGTQELSVTENGDYTPTGANIGFSSVHVSVVPTLTTKEITANGVYNASADNADGYSSVDVQVPEPTGTIEITSNGVVNVKNYASADVNVTAQAEQFGLPVSCWSKLDVDANGDLVSVSPAGALRFDGVVGIKTEGLIPDNWFYNNANITGVSFPDLEIVYGGKNFYQSFNICNGITGTIAFPKLGKVGDYANNHSANNVFTYTFAGCNNISGVNLSALKEIYDGMSTYGVFGGTFSASGVSGAVDLSSLEYIRGSRVMISMFSTTPITSVDMSALKEISLGGKSFSSSCAGMFSSCYYLTSVDLSSLTTIESGRFTSGASGACQNMFNSCDNLVNVDLSSLETIKGANCCLGMFYACRSLQTIDLSSLTEISGNYFTACDYMFKGCTNLSSVDLSGLQQIGGDGGCRYMFQNCTSLTSMNFASLTSMIGGDSIFSGCTSLTSVSFPALTVAGARADFAYWLSGVDGCTLHFPSNLQSTIEAKSGYPNFGGTNTTVLFDLPATA